MFPVGTNELPVPDGFERCVTDRGVFHFNAAAITAEEIGALSAAGRENLFLNLGPYSKEDVVLRSALSGGQIVCLTEYTQDGVEVRCAIGTNQTLPEQWAYFEQTKEPFSTLAVEPLTKRVADAVSKSGVTND